MTIDELCHELAGGSEHVIEDTTLTAWRGGTTAAAGGKVVRDRTITVRRRVNNTKQPWLALGTLHLNEDGTIRSFLVAPEVPFNAVARVLRDLVP